MKAQSRLLYYKSCQSHVSLPHGAIGLSAVYDSGIFWSYLLALVSLIKKLHIIICHSEVNSMKSTEKAITLIKTTNAHKTQQLKYS